MRRYNWILVLALLLAMGLPFVSTQPVYADTDTFYSSSSTGYMGRVDAVYATCHDATEAGEVSASYLSVGQWPGYSIFRATLYFDTSSIPDGATIDAVTLSLYGDVDLSVTDFNLIVRSGMPTYPHDPMVVGDYLHSHYSGTGNNSWNTSSMVRNAYNDIILNATGRGWIDKEGWTKLVLISEEDVNSSAPTAFEWVSFAGSAGLGSSPEPRLSVTYSASSTPTVTTNDATLVTTETARLHAYLDDDGGESCELQFQYDTGEIPWGSNETGFEGDYYTGNSYYKDISGLDNTGDYYTSTSDGFMYYTDPVYLTARNAAVAETSHTAGDTLNVGQALITGDYWAERAYIYFDTSPLPDGAETISATLWLYGTTGYEGGFDIVIQEGMPTYPHDPLVKADFDRTFYSGDGGSFDTDSWDDDGWNEIILNATGRGWISSTADTKFCLRSDDDINAVVPTDREYVIARSADYGIGSAAPMLEITTNMATYTFRAQAQNSQGTSSGSSKTFATLNSVGDPSGLWGDPSYNSVALNWTKGAGAQLSHLRYKAGEYPADETDGTLAYNSTGGSYTLTGLDAGETLYFRVWGQTASVYSANYSQVMVTTSAGSAAGAYDTPSSPGNWFLSPDPSNVSGLPGYDLVNNLADSYSIPQSIFWVGLAMFFVVAFGLVTYKMSDNLALSAVVVVVAIAVAGSMRLLPGYLAGLFFITALGIGFAGRKV